MKFWSGLLLFLLLLFPGFCRDALWALRLPVTTTFRVCDIWRGYWAQRLLWDLGGALVFLPPTVFQVKRIAAVSTHYTVHSMGHTAHHFRV